MSPLHHPEHRSGSAEQPDQPSLDFLMPAALEADSLAEFLEQAYTADSHLAFEMNLEAVGLLSTLEQIGMLPPREGSEERENVLRQLYVGALLAHLEHNLLISPILMFYPLEQET